MSRYQSVFQPGLFAGKTVIVTGGGSGIGRCTAHELAALGAAVAIVGRKVDKLDAVRAEIEAAGGVCSTHACDIREEDAVRATIAQVLERHGRIDGLVNNAGGQFPSPLAAISAKGWDAVVRNNLTGGFLMARECVTQWMMSAPGRGVPRPPSEGAGNRLGGSPASVADTPAINGGVIVNVIADIWGGMPGMGHSGAARGGVLTFTETAACEWGYAGVRVNAVAPGWIASSGIDTYDPQYRNLLRGLRTKVPLQRFGTEAELSSAVVFLLSEASGFISGSVIRVDGGVPTARHSWQLQPAERSFPYNGFPQYQPPVTFSDAAAPADLEDKS